jgi:hypothetical protein
MSLSRKEEEYRRKEKLCLETSTHTRREAMVRWLVINLIVLGLLLGAGHVVGLVDGPLHAYAEDGGD